MSPDERDIAADSLALMEASHRDDREAMAFILDECDRRNVAWFLAVLADSLLADLAEWNRRDDADLMADLRSQYLDPR